LQQSVLTAQELPAPLQVLTDEAQVLATGSHDPEQQALLDVHAAPVTVQVTPTPPVPPEPPLPLVPTLAELLPQLGSTSIAPMSSAEMTMMDSVVGEGRLMMGWSHQPGKTAHRAETLFCEPFHEVGESVLLEWVFS
jgi:hypothetical protein